MAMAISFGHDVLSVFDVCEDTKDFLAGVIESGDTPASETTLLVNQSLLTGSDNWHHLLSCAMAIKDSKARDRYSLDGNDVLTFVWHILSGHSESPFDTAESWAETDRLIAIAQSLAEDPEIQGPIIIGGDDSLAQDKPTRHRSRKRIGGIKSHYWIKEPSAVASSPKIVNALVKADGEVSGKHLPANSSCTSKARASIPDLATTSSSCHSGPCTLTSPKGPKSVLQPTASPYFANDATESRKASKRPPAGVVSSITFPSLTAERFGIIQEKLAHEPFWLLIAVTFLIKTKGQMAIPVFYQVRERFPSPTDLANPNNAEELSNMIRHLGLAVVRVAYIQKYATAFLETPPRPSVLYRVRNYDRREAGPASIGPGLFQNRPQTGLLTQEADKNNESEAWELGHMTQGKYALDSWRIFCRDELLGRADDWNGKGREPEFQPEWMRVMPHDKELRAYLRWMWMREGWEWDPSTGERTVLRDELRRAVDEGRVEYDNTGGLRILRVPRQDEGTVT